ncbi:hypothetical protein [Candidatus Symbiothrix dinenymphae]|uniref:hypothetical protein n=1 Tax=Candidatus Symbiothrix dinenymphae TaxID=467085 RepID=UPI0006C46EF8|nr:hypothetical protein [Candidatus Symbiothrix dinenymphae]GAP73009.1 hypothetical protein SAMD00024442_54_11 [Candidatus Symbiothrix dinenymphae]
MKKYFILTGMVALMSSCNGDIYDNINELVDSETVYPAGYVQTNVKLRAGLERVEIDLLSSRDPDSLYLPRAVKTVVEYADTVVEFEPARSFVNIEGLKIAQVYHFKIYTKDKYGNVSTPVTAEGKPITQADIDLLMIDGLSYTANTTQAAIVWKAFPNVYTVTEVTYSYTNASGTHSTTASGSRNLVVLSGLSASQTLSVDLSFKVLPKDAIEEVPLTGYNLNITTMNTADLNAYLTLTTPFPPTAATYIGNPYYVTNLAPFVLSAGAYDFGGPGKALFRANGSSNDGNAYRNAGGETGGPYNNGYGGIDYNARNAAGTPGLVGVGWMGERDWWVYTVEVVDAGIYKLEYNRAKDGEGAFAVLTCDNMDILGRIPITNNRNWSLFEWVDPQVELPLDAGLHKFKWTAAVSNHNFGGLRLTFVRPFP